MMMVDLSSARKSVTGFKLMPLTRRWPPSTMTCFVNNKFRKEHMDR